MNLIAALEALVLAAKNVLMQADPTDSESRKRAVENLFNAIEDYEALAEASQSETPGLEACAAEEHKRWSRWYLWQRDHSTPENIARWDRQATTDYADLSESEKESDRKEARLLLAASAQAPDGGLREAIVALRDSARADLMTGTSNGAWADLLTEALVNPREITAALATPAQPTAQKQAIPDDPSPPEVSGWPDISGKEDGMSQKERDALSRPLTDTEQMLVELARKDERRKISKDIFVAGAVAGGTMARHLSSDEEWREWLKGELLSRYPDSAPQDSNLPHIGEVFVSGGAPPGIETITTTAPNQELKERIHFAMTVGPREMFPIGGSPAPKEAKRYRCKRCGRDIDPQAIAGGCVHWHVGTQRWCGPVEEVKP